jgi:hypothetical protein
MNSDDNKQAFQEEEDLGRQIAVTALHLRNSCLCFCLEIALQQVDNGQLQEKTRKSFDDSHLFGNNEPVSISFGLFTVSCE